MITKAAQVEIGGDGLDWAAMGETGDNLPYSRIQPEVVKCSGDSGNEVHTIDTNVYAHTSRPKGYARQASVGENTDPTSSDSH
jgi:hypothetical protein